MRIAFLTTEYITEESFDGGIANYLHRVTHGMQERGHDVEIFTLSDKNECILHDGIRVNRVKEEDFSYRVLNRLTRRKIGGSVRVLVASYNLKSRVLRRHCEKPFDIIQVPNHRSPGLFLTFNRPAPIITRASSYEPFMRKFYRRRLNADQKVVEKLELLAQRRSDAIYAPSQFLSEVLREKANIAVDVLRPPFSIATSEFDQSVYADHLHGKKYLLFYGAIGLLKGCGVLARILPNILSNHPDLYFVFAGPVARGPRNKSMLEYILEEAGDYGKRIIYLGSLPHPQLYPVISHSVSVVLPSLVDNLPNTMIEAMALRKVVIGTRGTSFEEFIDDGISGILVEPDNPGDLLVGIERVLKMNHREREIIGEEACKRIDLLSPDRTCIELERYFYRFLAKN